MVELIDGEGLPQGSYSGEVTEMPECFNNWVRDNEERIETAKSEPYFIRDNRAAVQRVLGNGEPPISMSAPKRTVEEIAAGRHAARTQAQIDEIKRRYWMRWEPDGLTEAEKNANIDAYLQLERDLGIKRGHPMSFQEANELRGNPNYL